MVSVSGSFGTPSSLPVDLYLDGSFAKSRGGHRGGVHGQHHRSAVPGADLGRGVHVGGGSAGGSSRSISTLWLARISVPVFVGSGDTGCGKWGHAEVRPGSRAC